MDNASTPERREIRPRGDFGNGEGALLEHVRISKKQIKCDLRKMGVFL